MRKTLLAIAVLASTVVSVRAQVFHRPKKEPQLNIESVITPQRITSKILQKGCYQVSYNKNLFIPNWVCWELTPEAARSEKASVEGTWRMDPDFQYTATLDDFADDAYALAPMCPPGDRRMSEKAVAETYLMTNGCAMNWNLYNGQWFELEQKCRYWAKKYKSSVYISCGPFFFREDAVCIGPQEVMVPDAYFKIVAQKRGDKWVAAGFLFPNCKTNAELQTMAHPVGILETMTGYVFLAGLPEDVKKEFQISVNHQDWIIPGWTSQ